MPADGKTPRGRPFAVRFQVPLALVPFAAGIGTALALWGSRAPSLFFSTAAEVLALGAVAIALRGRLFRVTTAERRIAVRGVVMATLLVAVGTGLAFAFGALAREDGGGPGHLALVAGALAMGAAAIAVQAMFGIPGASEDEEPPAV